MAEQNKVEAFVASWNGKGYEKGDTQRFWMELLGHDSYVTINSD